MLFKQIMKFFILYIGFILSLPTFAVVENIQIHNRGTVRISTPADAASFGTLVEAFGTSGYYATCASSSANYALGRIDYETPLVFTGRLYNENYLYESTVPGLAIIPNYMTQAINTGDMLNGTNFSIPPKSQTVWVGNLPNSQRIKNNLQWNFRSFLYKDATRLQSGTYNIPEQTLFRLKCYDTSGTLQEIRSFNGTAIQVIVNVTGCAPTQKSAIIQMDGIPLPTMESAAVGALLGTKYRSFSLTCNPNVKVYVSINDLVNPSNTGGVVSTLTADSTATGVGYVVTTSGQPAGLILSPPGSAPGIAGVNQYYFGETGANGANLSDLKLGFSYTKTANTVTEGTAKSLIGITYSYQ